ncbi:MAG: isoprenyl transferase [Desulfobulbaceae bacterium]|nr:isoprenyl transferase [Desulfobulbaceae bacterium]
MSSPSNQLDRHSLPAHVAIIMDGNGRWAQNRGMIRLLGHKSGVKTVKKIVTAASELGIKVLTLYAFSTENWKRPEQEVSGLMSLLKSYLENELSTMLDNNIKLRCMGRKEQLPWEVQQVLDSSINKTANNTGLVLNLALSYGGRSEIVRAANKLAKMCAAGTLHPDEITEDLLAENLYSAGLPDPDLVIRTGGEYRLSNFLLWQVSYAELYITETNWPDFTKEDFHRALTIYQERQRRFGKTGDQVKK